MLAEELRTFTLSQFGQYSDSRAKTIVETAIIVLTPSKDHWQISTGAVHPMNVLLGVTAQQLAIVKDYPAIVDALCAVFSAVFSTHHEVLQDLKFYWGQTSVQHGAVYRSVEQYHRLEYTSESLQQVLANIFMNESCLHFQIT